MKTLLFEGNKKLKLVEAPDPVPGQGEVLIKTMMSGVCGSEMKTYRTDGQPSGNPGHEAAGVVLKTGLGVQKLKAGDRVGVSAIVGCGSCAYCAKGQYTWCDKMKFYGSAHATCFVTAEAACHVLPDDVPWDVGVLISGDGLGVPYHTNTKIPSEAKTVAVFGLGPIGLGSVLLQSWLGRKVIAVDVSEFRLAYASKLGAWKTISASSENPVDKIKEWTDGGGVDVAIEAAGRPETAKQCFGAVRKGGIVVFNGEQPAVQLSPSDDFIRRDITAIGAWYYHFHEYNAMLDLFRKGLPVRDMISHTFPLDDASEAYKTFADGLSAKVLLKM